MKLSKENIQTLGCVIGLWVGAFLPWVEVTKTDGTNYITGVEIDGGRIVILVGILALGIMLLAKNNFFQGVIALAVGIFAGLISLAHVMYIGGHDAKVGIGLVIALLSSIGFVIMGIRAFKQRDTRYRTKEPSHF
ncbi:MAG: hypothetical protein ACXAB4_08275 [Candidatus Hodarchaeales archaeon]|jgi:hypothetical protein